MRTKESSETKKRKALFKSKRRRLSDMGRRGSSISFSVTSAALVLVAVFAVASFAQEGVPDCAQKLTGCAEFLKSSNPPASCCDPLKQAVATQLDCLCNLYTSPGFFSSLGINVADALNVGKACGVPVDLSKCNKTSSSGPAPRNAPPAVPGNDAKGLALTGLTSLLMFLVSLIFY